MTDRFSPVGQDIDRTRGPNASTARGGPTPTSIDRAALRLQPLRHNGWQPVTKCRRPATLVRGSRCTHRSGPLGTGHIFTLARCQTPGSASFREGPPASGHSLARLGPFRCTWRHRPAPVAQARAIPMYWSPVCAQQLRTGLPSARCRATRRQRAFFAAGRGRGAAPLHRRGCRRDALGQHKDGDEVVVLQGVV